MEASAGLVRPICLNRDELRYTLCVDPKDVYGDDFPGETFRVQKEKVIKQYGDASQLDEKVGVGEVG